MNRPVAAILSKVRKETIMPDSSLTLTVEEREFLVGLLERTLKEKLVEEHRTRTPSYRAVVEQEENVIKGLLTKLGRAE
jgi:hypothetical protein